MPKDLVPADLARIIEATEDKLSLEFLKEDCPYVDGVTWLDLRNHLIELKRLLEEANIREGLLIDLHGKITFLTQKISAGFPTPTIRDREPVKLVKAKAQTIVVLFWAKVSSFGR